MTDTNSSNNEKKRDDRHKRSSRPGVSNDVGLLLSELTIELHTQHAIGLWKGRSGIAEGKGKGASKPSIISMPRFLGLVTEINKDALRNNPWADMAMLKLENVIARGHRQLEKLIARFDKVMGSIPEGVTLSKSRASRPQIIEVYTTTPLGYRGVFLLIGYDQFAQRVIQAANYGFISHNQRHDFLSDGSRLVREMYGVVTIYESAAASRQDAIEDNAAWRQACERLGMPTFPVLLGRSRSSYAPPVSEACLNMLRLRYSGPDDNSVHEV